MLFNLIYAILIFIYGLVLLKEDDRLWRVLGLVLLVISVLSMIGLLAIEISR